MKLTLLLLLTLSLYSQDFAYRDIITTSNDRLISLDAKNINFERQYFLKNKDDFYLLDFKSFIIKNFGLNDDHFFSNKCVLVNFSPEMSLTIKKIQKTLKFTRSDKSNRSVLFKFYTTNLDNYKDVMPSSDPREGFYESYLSKKLTRCSFEKTIFVTIDANIRKDRGQRIYSCIDKKSFENYTKKLVYEYEYRTFYYSDVLDQVDILIAKNSQNINIGKSVMQNVYSRFVIEEDYPYSGFSGSRIFVLSEENADPLICILEDNGENKFYYFSMKDKKNYISGNFLVSKEESVNMLLEIEIIEPMPKSSTKIEWFDNLEK